MSERIEKIIDWDKSVLLNALDSLIHEAQGLRDALDAGRVQHAGQMTGRVFLINDKNRVVRDMFIRRAVLEDAMESEENSDYF